MSLLDSHRCPGCGREARVFRDLEAAAVSLGDGEFVLLTGEPGGWWRIDCFHNDCPFPHAEGPDEPTVRHFLTTDFGGTGGPIGPGLGRLLVEAIEQGEPSTVSAGPSRDEIRATLQTLPAAELLEWAVLGASPPVPGCGHRGDDGCCNFPDHVSAECHAGAPCPLVRQVRPGTGIPAPQVPPGEAEGCDIADRMTRMLKRASGDVEATTEYTSDPPPPSPEGVTEWYRHSHPRLPSAYIMVRGDLHEPVWPALPSWDGGYTIDEWEEGERRSVHPVPAPEWAGEGE